MIEEESEAYETQYEGVQSFENRFDRSNSPLIQLNADAN